MFEAGYECPTTMICCYPTNEGFIKASAENILKVYKNAENAGHKNPRVLFSAHGLPESVIKDGDPYQWQCEESARKIAEEMNIKDLDWRICYQSRVGPQKWIGPSTEEELENAGKDGRSVIVYPHAFTQEHVETLVELDFEYKEEAELFGVPGYYRAETVGTHSVFIEGLANLVRSHQNKLNIEADGGHCICPGEFNECCMREMAS